jgi:arginine utilization protein RocB
MERKRQILDLFLKLVSIKSDTNSVMEIDVEKYIFNYFNDLDTFIENETCGMHQLDNDPLGRSVVWALVKGKENKTIILLNHHDVVDSEDYGHLKDFAYDPIPLKKALKKLNNPSEIENDLNSEEWLFGRGTADMKAGAAIQMVLMKEYAMKDDFKGNLLFLSVPDEETLSSGACSSLELIDKIKSKYDLDYTLLVNSEPHTREKDEYTVYDGSVGKTMATVYVAGKKCHIGDIFEGINPSLILSNILLRTEVNASLSDCMFDEKSPPPSWSFTRDFKPNYDASIPEAAGGYLSYLTLDRTPNSILKSLKEICVESFKDSNNHLKRQHELLFPRHEKRPDFIPNVKTYEELLNDAKKINMEDALESIERGHEKVKEMLSKNKISTPEANFIIIKDLLEIAEYNKPTVVIAFSPPYYPHVSSRISKSSKETMEQVMDILRSSDSKIERKGFFMGISDLSYFGLQQSKEIMPFVEPNMPLWSDDIYSVPFNEMKKLDMASIILGPWGKDIHKRTERVYLPDLVKKTPLLIDELIEGLI